MKKSIIMMAVAAIVAVAFAACSGNKSENAQEEAASAEAVVPEAENVDFDFDGLTELMKKKDITSDDYDFLLDQAELLADKTEGMTLEEYRAYFDNMTGDEQGALIVIGMGLDSAKKSGKLNGKQLRRFEEIEARSPKK